MWGLLSEPKELTRAQSGSCYELLHPSSFFPGAESKTYLPSAGNSPICLTLFSHFVRCLVSILVSLLNREPMLSWSQWLESVHMSSLPTSAEMIVKLCPFLPASHEMEEHQSLLLSEHNQFPHSAAIVRVFRSHSLIQGPSYYYTRNQSDKKNNQRYILFFNKIRIKLCSKRQHTMMLALRNGVFCKLIFWNMSWGLSRIRSTNWSLAKLLWSIAGDTEV